MDEEQREAFESDLKKLEKAKAEIYLMEGERIFYQKCIDNRTNWLKNFKEKNQLKEDYNANIKRLKEHYNQ